MKTAKKGWKEKNKTKNETTSFYSSWANITINVHVSERNLLDIIEFKWGHTSHSVSNSEMHVSMFVGQS